jgi:hypothetical protein
MKAGLQPRGNTCKNAQEARDKRRDKGRAPHYISKRPPVDIPPEVPGAGAAGDLAVGGGGILDLAVFGDVTAGEVLIGIGIAVF